jgi:hypothetical protein
VRRFTWSLVILAVTAATSRGGQYIMTVSQVGNDVVASGSGSFDLTALTFQRSAAPRNAMIPLVGTIQIGSASNSDEYTGITGPTSFGAGGVHFSSSQSGDFTGIAGLSHAIEVPTGYVSGTELSGGAIWDNSTLASLGLTPGTYTYTWGTGVTASSFEVIVSAVAVPEPSGMMLAGTVIGCVGLSTWIRRRGVVAAAA